MNDNFRQSIKLDGLAWEESICLPARFLSFLGTNQELNDKDKIILLRLYTLLQYMDPDIEEQIIDLCQKLDDTSLINYQTASEEQTEADEVKPQLILDSLLMPLFNQLYPEIKERVYGYKFFIQGELMGWFFPRHLMSLIKYMEVTDAQHKKKNVTNHFILAFIFQMVFRDKKYIPDDYFVAGRQLNVNQDNLLFALSKTSFEHHELGINVVEGKVISEIIETDVTINSEDNNYENATRLYYKLKSGEQGDQQLTDKALKSWETQWKKLCIDYNITIDEVINLLPKLFGERKPEFVPSIFARKENDPSTSLGGLLVMLRNRKAEKKSKKFNVLKVMGA